MKTLDLNALDSHVLHERIKDLKASSPSTFHPIDRHLEKIGLVYIKDGRTYLNTNG